jgi:hypothetical protein
MTDVAVTSAEGETYLRRVVEAELRGIRDGVGGGHGHERVRRIARALRAVGRLDETAAEAVLADFGLARQVRLPEQPSPARSTMIRRPAPPTRQARVTTSTAVTSVRQSVRGRTAPAPAAAAVTELVLPIDVTMPLTSADASGEMHLLAYVQTATRTMFSMHGPVRETRNAGGAARAPAIPPPAFQLLRSLAATDEAGTGYRISFSGRLSGDTGGEWTGLLHLTPDPPPGIRWLDLTAPGSPTTRVSLEPAPGPAVTIERIALSPGEQLLHRMAAQVLAEGARAGGLGDIATALIAVGALSPASPVPGQLAALCDRLGLGHDIAAEPTPELPEQWQSVLSQLGQSAPAEEGCASLAVALPELDGIRLLIPSIHIAESTCYLQVAATGVPETRRPDDLPLPTLWLRDDAGGWHVTVRRSWSGGGGDVTALLMITPPLPSTAWVEIVAAGQSAQARVAVPLHLRQHRTGGGTDVV